MTIILLYDIIPHLEQIRHQSSLITKYEGERYSRMTTEWGGSDISIEGRKPKRAKSFMLVNLLFIEDKSKRMMSQLALMTHQEMQELRQAVLHIINKHQHLQHCQTQSQPQQALQSTQKNNGIPSSNIEMVSKLSAILINILDQTSRVMHENDALRVRSQELLQGIQSIQLDYYQLREQNDRIKELLSEYEYRIETVNKQRDASNQKYEILYEQFYNSTKCLQQEIQHLKRQLCSRSFMDKTDKIQQNSQYARDMEQQVAYLKAQLVEIRKKCFQYRTTNLQLQRKLDQAETNLRQINSQCRYKVQQQSPVQPQIILTESSKDYSSSNIFLSSNLRNQLENLSGFYHTDHIKSSNYHVVSIQNHSFSQSFLPNYQEQVSQPIILLNQPVAPQQKPKNQIITANTLAQQTSFFKLLLEDRKQNDEKKVDEEIVKEMGEYKCQTPLQKSDKKEENKGGKEQLQYELDLKKKIQKYGSYSKSRVKSLKNILINSATRDSNHHAKLYRKYRGQLESKYPNLKKFTNKVLEKKGNEKFIEIKQFEEIKDESENSQTSLSREIKKQNKG